MRFFQLNVLYLAIAKRLAEQDKSNAGWQRDLSVGYGKVGDVLDAQGKLPEALDAYQQYLTIARRLAEQDETNSDWQRDLIVSLFKVGTTMGKIGGKDNLAHAREHLAHAREHLQSALSLAAKYSGPDRAFFNPL